MIWKSEWTGKATVAAIAIALAFQILVPPVVGLANNGDFGKVTGRFSLDWPRDDNFRYIVALCPFGPGGYWDSGFYTSELVPAAAAMTLNRVVTKVPYFDLRCIGFVHAGLFLTAIGLAIPALSHNLRIAVCGLTVLLFTDALYATNFNSFYMDSGAIVFFALAAAFYLRVRRRPSRADAAGLLLCSVLFLASKPQHAVLCAPIAMLILWRFSRDYAPKIGVSAAVVLLGTGILTFRFGAPPEYAPLNVFNVIFMKIIPASKDPGSELRELGLDDSHKQYAGMFAYWPDSPMQDPDFAREFARRTSFTRIGWFLLQHPARAYRVLREALNEAGRIRPPLGNFDRSAGLPELTETQGFTFASGFKRAVFEGRGSRYLFFFLFLGIASIAVSRDRPASLALASTGVLAMLTAVVGDAVEHARHFVVFHVIVDIMAVAFVASAADRLSAR